MTVLSCKNLNKSYGIDVILKDISFNMLEGDKIGLIGANGAGKSTLFKILTKEINYDEGDLYIDKNKKIGYLSQHLSLESENTIFKEQLEVFNDLVSMEEDLKNLQIKMNEPYDINNEEYHNKIIKKFTSLSDLYNDKGGYTYKGEIHRVLTGLGFNENEFDKPINILSGGEKTRVALCKLLLQNPDIILLDEPTNHLDLNAIEWLESYLKNYKGTLLIISHDRYFLDAVTEKTFELINGKIKVYNGNYSQFIELKKKNFEVQLKAYNLQQQEIKRQQEVIERYKSFNREKSIRAAESRQKLLDKMEKIESPDKDLPPVKIKLEPEIKSGNDVLHIENLKKSFGDKLLFENLNLDVKRNEINAIIGENGRGKSTLFKIIKSEETPDNGIIELGTNVFVGYYDQEQSDLHPNKTVLNEIWDDFPKLTETKVRSILAAFLFKGDDVFKQVSSLSGGEKCKLNIIKLMLSKSNFLLLDEPTNHLDIMSREALEDALFNYSGTVLVISHDRYFLNKVVNKIYELEQNGIKEYLGNYSYYLNKKNNPLRFQQEEEDFEEGKTKTQIKQEKKKKKEIEKLEKQKKLEASKLEKEISNTEEKLLSLQNDLCKEEIYSNPEKAEQINKKIKEIESLLESLYENWENLI